MLIDLHTHTFMSDGALLPSEHVRRAWVKGYRAVAITDHADISNIESLLRKSVPVCRELSEAWPITALPGVELTHVPPGHIDRLTKLARSLGARVVVMHGETPVEPVPPGTNMAAIEARVDILAHPGILTEEEARRAAELGVALELSARRGHCLGRTTCSQSKSLERHIRHADGVWRRGQNFNLLPVPVAAAFPGQAGRLAAGCAHTRSRQQRLLSILSRWR